MIGIIFLVFVVFLALGVPIAFSVGWTSLVPYLMDSGFTADSEFVFRTMVNGLDSYVLLAIPLFMLSSSIMAASGLSIQLFRLLLWGASRRNAHRCGDYLPVLRRYLRFRPRHRGRYWHHVYPSACPSGL